MELRSMLANEEDDLEEASVCRFYIAIVNKMINIFPFHDDVLRDLAALNPDPALRESRSARLSSIWLFALASWQMNITRHSSLSFTTTSCHLMMNCHSTLLTVVSTRSGQRWQRRHLLVECAFHI